MGQTEALRAAEYELQREVERLARELYEPREGKDLDALARAIAAAQRELAERSEQRRAAAVADATLVDRRAPPPLMGPGTTGLDVKIELRMERVPTSIVNLLDATTPLVSFEVRNAGAKWARLRISSEVQGYSARAVDTVEIAPGGTERRDQLPAFSADRLRAVTEATRAALTVCVEILGQTVELERTFPLWLLARTNAYLGYTDPAKGKHEDLTRYLGAFVTPDAPEVTALLRAAAELHPDKQMVGYQVDAAGVEAQVAAAFAAVRAAEIRYVNSIVSFGAAPGYASQRIRLPREAVASRSANCIDGTVLLASVLEAASLRPAIVVVPGHAFLAWQKAKGGDWDYVETTMVAKHPFAAARDQARALAAAQQAAAGGDPYAFRRLPLLDLRAQGVYPME
jgi:hypothetical protein